MAAAAAAIIAGANAGLMSGHLENTIGIDNIILRSRLVREGFTNDLGFLSTKDDKCVSKVASSIRKQRGAVGVAAGTGSKDPQTQQMWMQAYGAVTTVGGMLPYSRSHETEADKIGLYLMAIAGYNPDQAAELWKRMGKASNGQAPPEFLSTHPATETRIENLTNLAPKAKAEANKFGVTSFRPLSKF